MWTSWVKRCFSFKGEKTRYTMKPRYSRYYEQRKATNTSEKWLFIEYQCSQLRNRGVTHAHITCLPRRLAYSSPSKYCTLYHILSTTWLNSLPFVTQIFQPTNSTDCTQPVMKFPVFYSPWRFTTAFTADYFPFNSYLSCTFALNIARTSETTLQSF
jgi:hypothetical protein